MAGISDMSLWCLEIPPGGCKCIYQIEQSPRSLQVVHVTNAALPGPNTASGQHCLTIKKQGQGSTDFTLCTLNKDTHPQHNLDFIMDETVEFKNHGKGPVHLAGYETFSCEQDSGDEDDEDEEDEEDDSEEAPQAVKLEQQPSRAANGRADGMAGKMKANGMPQARQQVTTDEDSDDDDESDDEDYEAENDQGTSDGMEGSDLDEGDDEDEGSDDEEDEQQKDDDNDEASSDDEEQLQQQQLAKVGSKRPAPSPAAPAPSKKQQQKQQQPMTPAPKKAKQAEQAKQAPASAPAKQQQGKQQEGKQTPSKGTPANEQEYQAAVINYLRSQPNKTAPLAKIGTAVPRPSGVPKLGPWTKSKADIFKLDANNQNVTLLK
mmetsp:Transcript_15403/g.40633  ORF Transcript_15403/g.40633 Transcript_15403/m.40633 type:complete len:376 (+) Transcript_15403:87-1214(+)